MGHAIAIASLGSSSSGAAAWNPLTVANAVWYLNADLGSPSAAQWTDQSATGCNLTQATGARQFQFLSTGGINGKASYKATGVSPQFMTGAVAMNAMMGSATAAELFILAQLPSDASSQLVSLNWGSGDTSSFLEFTDSKVYSGFCTSARKNGNAITAGILTSPFVQNVQSSSSAFTINIYGTSNLLPYFTTATNTFAPGTSVPTFGSSGSAAGGYQVRMIIAFSRVLSPTERSYIVGGMV